MYAALESPQNDDRYLTNITVATPDFAVRTTVEKFIVQELQPGFHPSMRRTKEFRIHTLEDKVIVGATYKRWSFSPFPVRAPQVEQQVETLLSQLPKSLLRGLDMSLDVVVATDGKIKIVDVNTAGTKNYDWSGYLANPWTRQAYALHLEANYNMKFSGLDGFLLRNAIPL